ncbi:MAG: hypothetical protein P8H45_06510 [Flavobacteriaceae bacterium]|nr:hypothetical protein [Flavobacteriaceae bacterium]
MDHIQPLADQSCYTCPRHVPAPLEMESNDPAKPNCFMSIKTYIQSKTGIEQNAIQHGLKHNLVRFLLSFTDQEQAHDLQNPEPNSV